MGYYAGDYYPGGDYYAGDPGKLRKLKGLGKLKKLGKKAGALAAMAGKAKGLLPAMKGGRARRHRRMHVTNVRALKRAMRRVQGFSHLARKTIGFTKRVHMKKRRRGRF